MEEEDEEETLIVENDRARLRTGAENFYNQQEMDDGSRQTVLYRYSTPFL